ncbi:MAG: FAD-binding protein [Planctomycetota bacterium]
MPTLSLNAARKLESSFEGRITSTHQAQAEFLGKPTVLIPESTEDIEKGLRLARAADLPVFVRSGNSVSANDVGKSATARKSTDVIMSMEAFRGVAIDGQRVTVGSAATTADVAEKLAGTGLFLPLGDNPTQSIVSAVLSMDVSPFLRSGTGGGPLRDAVVEAEVIPTDGTGAGKTKTIQRKALRELLAGGRPAVIANLVFDASALKVDDSGRWLHSWMTVYEPKSFAKLCDALFGPRSGSLPEQVDLSVRVTSAAYDMKLVIVRITGHGDADETTATTFVQSAFDRSMIHVIESNQVKGSGSSVAAWMATGANAAADGEVLKRFGSNIAPRPFENFRKQFLDAVSFTIGVSPRTQQKRASGIRAWFELQLASDGNVVARAEMSDVHAKPKIAFEAQRRITEAIPADKVSPTAAVASRALVRRGAGRAVARGVSVLPSFAPTLGFSLVSSNRLGSAIIPGFRGDVYDASAGPQYRTQIQQYAVSSYTPQVVAARMTPQYVAMPLDAADVATAVQYAADNSLKIVTRSGGHQYCGLSSGGNRTLLLDMKVFNKVVFSPSTGIPTQVTVGPGVALKDVSKMLRANGVVIPHGECPLVRLGGHVQTGGIGHQLRSLGATLDWVRSFKMVTRDPQAPGVNAYAEHTFTRPQAGAVTLADEMFRAVLGGGPSSWGVLTEITFDLVSDKKYPTSAGYSRTYLYEKEGFSAAMEQFRKWAERQSSGRLPKGIDFFLSVVSGDREQLRPGALLVEMMCTDENGVKSIKTVVDAVDDAVSIPNRIASHLFSPIQGSANLSVIADKGVREIGAAGLPASGREFDLPYKKSLHITMTPFSQVFCDAFVDLVDTVFNHSKLKVVVQAVIGGGEFLANGKKKLSHMQRRDALVQLVFDVFYEDEDGVEAIAEGFQNQMKGLLNHYSDGADIRMLWGTFEDAKTNGAQLDMRRREVQDFYYDSQAEYSQLKQIKSSIDPNDVFHTSFTVQ